MRNACVAMVSVAALGLFGITTMASAQDTSTKTYAHKHNSRAQTADPPSVSGLDARATAIASQSTNSGCRMTHDDLPSAQVVSKYIAVCGPE
jgi:hypothetical protein